MSKIEEKMNELATELMTNKQMRTADILSRVQNILNQAILAERENLLKKIKSKMSKSHSDEWNIALEVIALELEVLIAKALRENEE